MVAMRGICAALSGQLFEIITQLRGSAGMRQVKDAKEGLAPVRGSGGNCAVKILKIDHVGSSSADAVEVEPFVKEPEDEA